MGVKSSQERNNKKLKILLFGDAGVGKTHFALTSTPSKILVFDAESGTDFFEGRKGFDFDYWVDDEGLKTSSIKELMKAIEYLESQEGRKKYETFVIDPISDIWDNIQSQRAEYKDIIKSKKSSEYKKNPINDLDLESFNQKDWADMKRVYKDLMLSLKNLPQNVILVAREKEISETKPDGSIVKTGEYTFDAEKNTKYAVDFILRMVYDDKVNKRWIIVQKSRADGLEKNKKIENPTFTIFDKVVNSIDTSKEVRKSISQKEENIFEEENKEEEEIEQLKEIVIQVCKEHGGSKNPEVMKIVKSFVPNGNTNSIKDKETLLKIIEMVNDLDSQDEEVEE
ncbi:MAG: hypothetical protein KatS3mg002_1018 [Candidatus Woesearchaeota archaeon]|jgi:hypothetical protein|nr:MAG: hypothetical protein KatS3mg002_1018 [Candidatus Woesearchaeota archaeon]